jgi:hypothetical protein
MKKLLTAALILALGGAADAEGAAATPAPGSEKSGQAPAAEKRAGAKDKKRKETRPKQTDRAATPPAGTSGAKAAEKPCEPVKPCPID